MRLVEAFSFRQGLVYIFVDLPPWCLWSVSLSPRRATRIELSGMLIPLATDLARFILKDADLVSHIVALEGKPKRGEAMG